MKSALCFLAVCASAPALAQPPVIVSGELLPFATVSYADLDLGQSAGVDRLRMRVRAAARYLCIDGTRQPLSVSALERACYRTAMERANRDVDQAVGQRDTIALTGAAQLIVRSR